MESTIVSPVLRTQPAAGIGSTLAFVTERLVAPVEGMHRVIAGRWFGSLEPVAAPVRKVHDAVASAVYGSVRLGAGVVGAGIDEHISVESGTADSIQAFTNGLWGDDLGRHSDRLEITMAIRDSVGDPVTIGPDLATAFPSATDRMVVLVHGLVETERCWHGTENEPGMAQVLENHTGLTPVSIRYNSGRRVSDNGALLASLLEEVRAEWPVPVQSIALVGNSMGGLVVRSACEAASAAGHRWIDDVDTVVTVGSPHQGSPLEKLANMTAFGLAIAPETRPLAGFVNRRSVGIKDLRFGAILEDDWTGTDPDALLRNTVGDHSLPSGISHHFVAGVVTSDPENPIGAIVGDLVVRPGSGIGRHLEPKSTTVIGGRSHADLLNDPSLIAGVMGRVVPPEEPRGR